MSTRTTTQPRSSYDQGMAALCLDCMENQKEKLHAMLIAIQDATPAEEQTLRWLIAVAKDLVENHEAWYRLRECLSIKREDQQ